MTEPTCTSCGKPWSMHDDATRQYAEIIILRFARDAWKRDSEIIRRQLDSRIAECDTLRASLADKARQCNELGDKVRELQARLEKREESE